MLPDSHIKTAALLCGVGAGHIYNDVVCASLDVLARRTPYRPGMLDYT